MPPEMNDRLDDVPRMKIASPTDNYRKIMYDLVEDAVENEPNSALFGTVLNEHSEYNEKYAGHYLTAEDDQLIIYVVDDRSFAEVNSVILKPIILKSLGMDDPKFKVATLVPVKYSMNEFLLVDRKISDCFANNPVLAYFKKAEIEIKNNRCFITFVENSIENQNILKQNVVDHPCILFEQYDDGAGEQPQIDEIFESKRELFWIQPFYSFRRLTLK